jgi:hypothetical protein
LAHADGTKSGGRVRGTPNKATRQLKKFLDGVFTEAIGDPVFRQALLIRIKTLDLDAKVLLRLLEYWAGAPQKQHTHQHQHSLASIIAGTAVDTPDDDELEDEA